MLKIHFFQNKINQLNRPELKYLENVKINKEKYEEVEFKNINEKHTLVLNVKIR